MEDHLIGKNKNAPELADKLAGKNPHIPVVDTTTAPEETAPAEECGEWIGEEYVTYPCGETTPAEAPTTEETSSTCPSVEYPIYAGAGGNDVSKGTNVGSVTYTNDGTNLYVTANYPGPTCPEEIHLWAGSDPSAVNDGSVAFGQFPYKLDNPGCGTHTFTIPLTDIYPSGDACGNDIYIILHAAMGAEEGAEDGEGGQTAIAHGEQEFAGSRWGWIATYPVCCD